MSTGLDPFDLLLASNGASPPAAPTPPPESALDRFLEGAAPALANGQGSGRGFAAGLGEGLAHGISGIGGQIAQRRAQFMAQQQANAKLRALSDIAATKAGASEENVQAKLDATNPKVTQENLDALPALSASGLKVGDRVPADWLKSQSGAPKPGTKLVTPADVKKNPDLAGFEGQPLPWQAFKTTMASKVNPDDWTDEDMYQPGQAYMVTGQSPQLGRDPTGALHRKFYNYISRTYGDAAMPALRAEYAGLKSDFAAQQQRVDTAKSMSGALDANIGNLTQGWQSAIATANRPVNM